MQWYPVMKNTYTFKSLLVASLLTLSTAAHAGKVTVAQFASPDENTPNCADTPAELATMKDLVAVVNTFGGLNAVVGTWKLSGIPFVNQKISFKYDSTKFIVQTNNEFPESVSLCSHKNAAGQPMLRVAVHSPGCPENKNIYILANGKGKFKLTAYGTKAIGTANFKQQSTAPLPDGNKANPVACAKQ